MRRRCVLGLSALSFGLLSPRRRGQAEGIDAAPVVLTVEGQVAGGETIDLTLEQIEALGFETLRTATPWTRGPQAFGGVPLRSLLRGLGVSGDMVASALNHYNVTIPAEDAERHGAFLATRLDGEPLRLRNRGPIWLIYPWSLRPELDQPPYHERAIWQLRRLEVR